MPLGMRPSPFWAFEEFNPAFEFKGFLRRRDSIPLRAIGNADFESIVGSSPARALS
jgi:hypothetical protein